MFVVRAMYLGVTLSMLMIFSMSFLIVDVVVSLSILFRTFVRSLALSPLSLRLARSTTLDTELESVYVKCKIE